MYMQEVLTTEFQRKLLYSMLRIRRVEERIDGEYLKNMMRTPIHLYGPVDNYHPENRHIIHGLIRKFHESKQASAPMVTI